MAVKNRKFKRIISKQKKKAIPSNPQELFFLQNNLQQALNFHRVGRLSEAEALCKKILQVKPDHPETLHLLGIIVHQNGKSRIAVKLIRKAIDYRPDYFEAYLNLGKVFRDQGMLNEAVESLRQAISLNPGHAIAHFNLGNVFFDLVKLSDAVSCFRQALSLKPDYAEVHNNLGVALNDLGQLEDAVVSYRRAIKIKPDFIQVHFNLGITLKDLGQLEEAKESFHHVLSLKPDYAEAYYNLGVILNEQGKLDEAVTCYQKALSLQPDLAEAQNNLGCVLNDIGKLEDAISSFRLALQLKKNYIEAHSNMLMCLNYLPDLSTDDYLTEAIKLGRSVRKKVTNRFSDWIYSPSPERLRIGLVSGDFRNHPVGYFLENMLACIDSSQFELNAYSTFPQEDDLTSRIRSYFASWKLLSGLNDEDAARMIHDDGVHILIDLSGHTKHNRMPVFSWKPAPLQVTWLGYFASTGIEEIDYLLTDPVSVPESEHENFTEKIWYLPETRFCFSPPVADENLPVESLPAFRNGFITFGCFQSISKINNEVLKTWGKIFKAMPQARLRLQNRQLNSQVLRTEMLRRLAQNGIAPEQVILEESVPRMQYLSAHAHVDIILDTFPFTGGTTTCEALWMGVPTLSLAGNSMVARQGASLLTCAGLTDWVALDREDYVIKALNCAAQLEQLNRLRAGLRKQLLESPLCDSIGFAHAFEAAMWGMWHSSSERE